MCHSTAGLAITNSSIRSSTSPSVLAMPMFPLDASPGRMAPSCITHTHADRAPSTHMSACLAHNSLQMDHDQDPTPYHAGSAGPAPEFANFDITNPSTNDTTVKTVGSW